MFVSTSKLFSLFVLAVSTVAAPAPQGTETFPTVVQGTTTTLVTRSMNLSRSTRVAVTTSTEAPIISLITTSVSGSNSVITSTIPVGATPSTESVAEPTSSVVLSSGAATELPTFTTPTFSTPAATNAPAATTSSNSATARSVGGYGLAAVAGVAGVVAAVL
ncbi:hypothetical protein FRC04_001017 [Tulasnella sp. 424]|nr:hypothetical protein FRC04_001017 [Tulasnella sp. 424]KAG8977925.1 hypothetical protein FRC05_000453 [Tulasnella sp. 425]